MTEEKTMPKVPTLEELEQAEQEAMTRVAQARAAADEIRKRAEQRRAEAQRQHDEALLRDWPDDRAALEQDIVEARERLRDAVLADPVWQAHRQVVLTGHRLATRSLEASNTRSRLHGPESWTTPTHAPPAPSWEELARLVEADANTQGRDEAEARDQARVEVGQVAADHESGR